MTAEQKAEEIANKRCHEIGCFGHCNFSSPKHHRCGEWHREYNCALDGYNEGFKDCAKARLNVTTISDCPIKDDWHYVKDELPELYKDVLVVFPRGDCDVKRLTNHNEWVGRGSWCSLTDVVAWKEIVLSELPKESE